VFIDTVLEDAGSSGYAEIYANHIRNASGLLFMVDPLQFNSVGRKILALNQIKDDVSAKTDPSETLAGLVDNYALQANIPTAAVLAKSDLLVALGRQGEYLRPRIGLFTRYNHDGHLNLSQSDTINQEVDAFLQLVDPNFNNALKGRFANLGLFGVSSLGAPPDLIHRRVASFAPARVNEPFLWILYKHGYIDGRHSDSV